MDAATEAAKDEAANRSVIFKEMVEKYLAQPNVAAEVTTAAGKMFRSSGLLSEAWELERPQ